MQEDQAFHKIISGMGKKGKRAKKRNVKPLLLSSVLFNPPKLNSLPEQQKQIDIPDESAKSVSDELKGFKKIIEKMVKNIISNTNNTTTQNKTSVENVSSIQNVFNANSTTNKRSGKNISNVRNITSSNNDVSSVKNFSSMSNGVSATKNVSLSNKNILVTTRKSGLTKIENENNKSENNVKLLQNGDLTNVLNESVVRNISNTNTITNRKYARPIQAKAKGGWISGPLKGYPVSLDGEKIDFIGHGTEFVARKPSGSFVIPVDTPETRKDPSLMERRVKEAKRAGFDSLGLNKKISLPKMKPTKISAKELPRLQNLQQKAVGGFLSGIADSVGGMVESSPIGMLAGQASGLLEKVTGVNPIENIKSVINPTETRDSRIEQQMIENNMVKTETEKILDERRESNNNQPIPLPIPMNTGGGGQKSSSPMIAAGGESNFSRVAKEQTMFPAWRRNMG
tara:strand:- start:169 stop:1533 length:1365 start_codon:yes stop_codon:yes gene_type:complete